jgi:hypothetical protein
MRLLWCWLERTPAMLNHYLTVMLVFWRTRLNVLSESDLDVLIAKIVEMYAGVHPCDPLDAVAAADDGVRARVQFSGWLDGVIEIAASRASASALAERMTGAPADVAIGGELLAELANTLAGQVKSMLGEGLFLGIPEVAPTSQPAAWPSFCRSYRCGDSDLTLTMWDKNPEVL